MDAVIQIVQELGLGVGLAVGIFWQLRKVLEEAQAERARQVEERAQFLKFISEEGERNRQALTGLQSVLHEIRGAVLVIRKEEDEK